MIERTLHSKNLYLFIITLGLVFRLLWIFLFDTYPETDFMWYHVKGIELSEGKGFLNGIYPYYIGTEGIKTAFRPIGYPGTLAILYYFFGTNFIVAKLFNVILAGVSLFLIYKLAKKFFSLPIANLSVFLYSFSPLAVAYTSIIGSETLFSTILVLSAYTFFVSKNRYLTGFLIGYLTLIRPIGMYIPLFFLIFILINNNASYKEKIKEFLIIGLMASLVVTPWLIRNKIEFGEAVFSSNGGYVAYVNNNPYARPYWTDPFKYPNSPMLKYKYENGFDEMGLHKEGKKLALQWAVENPRDFFKMGVRRLAYAYFLKLDDIQWAFTIGLDTWHPFAIKAVKIEKILYIPFYILTFFYLIIKSIDLLKKRNIDFNSYIIMLFLYFSAMMFVLEGNSRYVFPLHTFYSMSVSFVIILMYNKLWKKDISLKN